MSYKSISENEKPEILAKLRNTEKLIVDEIGGQVAFYQIWASCDGHAKQYEVQWLSDVTGVHHDTVYFVYAIMSDELLTLAGAYKFANGIIRQYREKFPRPAAPAPAMKKVSPETMAKLKESFLKYAKGELGILEYQKDDSKEKLYQQARNDADRFREALDKIFNQYGIDWWDGEPPVEKVAERVGKLVEAAEAKGRGNFWVISEQKVALENKIKNLEKTIKDQQEYIDLTGSYNLNFSKAIQRIAGHVNVEWGSHTLDALTDLILAKIDLWKGTPK